MAQVRFFLSCVPFVFLFCKVVGEMSADVVFDVLSRRLDNIMYETKSLRSDLDKAVNTIEQIENRVDNLKEKSIENEQLIASLTDNVSNDKMVKISESSLKDEVKQQAVAVRKMLSKEKILLREMGDSFVNKFTRLESEIESQMSSMTASVVSQIASINASVELSNEYLDRTINENVRDTSESVSRMKSDLEDAEHVFSSRFNATNSAIGGVKERLATVEIKQVTTGLWSAWSSWTTCTATCNTGMKSRQRKCNNHKSSSGLDFCVGSPSDVTLCNQQSCPRKQSSFSVSSPTKLSDGKLKFPNVILNEGSFYDKSTGVFTCHYPGLYLFIATFIEGGLGNNYFRCHIIINRSYYARMLSRNGADANGRDTTNGWGTATGAVTIHLVKGDEIYVSCSIGSPYPGSSFSGVLVSIDP